MKTSIFQLLGGANFLRTVGASDWTERGGDFQCTLAHPQLQLFTVQQSGDSYTMSFCKRIGDRVICFTSYNYLSAEELRDYFQRTTGINLE